MAEIDIFNRAFDYIVPVYCVLALVFIVLFNKRKIVVSSNPDRIYKFSKKNKNEVLTWQQQMTGTWDKIERKNFYEVCFSGC